MPNSLAGRMLGVIRAPRATFDDVAADPRWAGVLIVTFVVTAAASAALLETSVGQLALLDQWERTAIAFGQPVSDDQYAAMQEASESGAIYALLSSLATGPLLGIALAAILWAIFRATGLGRATYRQVLAVVAHAGVILMLRHVVAAPVIYARETLASPVTLGLFFTMLDEASPLARFAAAIDLFVIWWVMVLAIGMAVLYRRPTRRIALVFAGMYVLLAVILTTVMALTGGQA